MKTADTNTTMEQKRVILLDNCTRALCGDETVDVKLLDEATGGRYSKGDSDDAIKAMILTLKWLGISVVEKKVRKKRTAKAKSNGKSASNGPAKKRGRPRKNPEAATTPAPAPAPAETPAEQPSA